MITRIGKFHRITLVEALKLADPSCCILSNKEIDGLCSEISIEPSSPDKIPDIVSILDSHDADSSLLIWRAKQMRIASAANEIKKIPGWATWTAQEAEAWLEANVLNLESAKTVMKTMARIICHLRDHAGII
jgi:hypothetical protein